MESTWDRRLRQRMDFAGATLIRTPSLVKPVWNALVARGRVLKENYDAMIGGNPSRGFAPLLRVARRRGVVKRCTLLAHRTVRSRFARLLEGEGVTVVCVNGEIAQQASWVLPDARVVTHYGIPDADRYIPRTTVRRDGEPVRIGVLGKLNNQWTGAGDAIEAFRSMPDALCRRCELYLVS